MSGGHTNPSYADQYGGQYGAPPANNQMPPPGQAVAMQPVAGGMPMQGQQWMAKPAGFAGCPPGLEYLMQIDQLIIKQQKELIEVFTGWEQSNKYRIMNSVGQQVFFAAEESECCERQCCGPMRGFNMHILDNMNQEVIRVFRDFKCCAGCCWCADGDHCSLNVQVEAPVGTPVGYVRQEKSGWKPHFSIRSPDHTKIGVIRGPCCQCSGPCCDDVEFHIMNAPDENTSIGRIAKQWSGMHEFFTDADTFSVSFPADMDVRAKAAFIGAVFLIDFMYFEQKNNN